MDIAAFNRSSLVAAQRIAELGATVTERAKGSAPVEVDGDLRSMLQGVSDAAEGVRKEVHGQVLAQKNLGDRVSLSGVARVLTDISMGTGTLAGSHQISADNVLTLRRGVTESLRQLHHGVRLINPEGTPAPKGRDAALEGIQQLYDQWSPERLVFEPEAAQVTGGATAKAGKVAGRFARIPALDRVGRDISALAAEDRHKPITKRSMAPVIGQTAAVRKLAIILKSAGKNNAVIVAPPGTGKTAAVEALAQAQARGEIPLDKHIVSVPWSAIIGEGENVGNVGGWEQNLSRTMQTIADNNGIMFIDEIHNLKGLGASKKSDADVFNMLKEKLGRGEFPMIGATTDGEYPAVQSDPAFERRFIPVFLDELDAQETHTVLLSRGFISNSPVRLDADAQETVAQVGKLLHGHSPDREITLRNRMEADASADLELGPAALGELRDEIQALEINIQSREAESSDALRAPLPQLRAQRETKLAELAELAPRVKREQRAAQGVLKTSRALAKAKTRVDHAKPGKEDATIAARVAAQARHDTAVALLEQARDGHPPLVRTSITPDDVIREVAQLKGWTEADVRARAGVAGSDAGEAMGFALPGVRAKRMAIVRGETAA